MLWIMRVRDSVRLSRRCEFVRFTLPVGAPKMPQPQTFRHHSRARTRAMPTQANQPLPDGYQLQNYRIRKVLSCGGFSIVYLAEDENEMPVAIKEYLPASLALRHRGDALPAIAAENLATFRYGMKCFFEEGRSLARPVAPQRGARAQFLPRQRNRLHGDALRARPHAAGAHPDAPRRRLARTSSAAYSPSCSTACARCTRNKLLHLDIKPANIYIRNDGTPVLIDFGAARQTLTDEGRTSEPDVHAGLRRARAIPQARAAGPVDRHLQRRRQHVSPASRHPRPSPPTSAWIRTNTSARANAGPASIPTSCWRP